MKLADLKPGYTAYTQLGTYVLAVLSIREDGWCVYVGAVSGWNHDEGEWEEVARTGQKQNKAVALAIVENLFHPGFDTTGCPYVYD